MSADWNAILNPDMKKPIVAIDVDGCILDIYTPLTKLLHMRGYVEFSMNRVLTYDFNKSLEQSKVPDWLSKSSISGDFYLNAYRNDIFGALSSDETFMFAKLYPNCAEMLKKLSSVASIVLNTMSLTESIKEIKRHKLDFSGILLNSFVGAKPALDHADFVIDDSIFELDKYSSGTKKYLVNAPYNQVEFNNSENNFKDITRSLSAASAMYEIYCSILATNMEVEHEKC